MKHQPVNLVHKIAIDAHIICSIILSIVGVVSAIPSGWITFALNRAKKDLQINGIMNKKIRFAYPAKQGVPHAIMIGSVIHFLAPCAAINTVLFITHYNMEAASKINLANRMNIIQSMIVNASLAHQFIKDVN